MDTQLSKKIKKTKINITFVLPSLVAGGAERIMSFVAQSLDKKKFNSRLLIIGYAKDAAYKVEGIDVKYLNKHRVLVATPQLFEYLWVNETDIVVSTIGHLNTLMGLLSVFFPKTKFVGREASVKSVMNGYSIKRKLPYEFLFQIGHKLLDAVICQSIDMANDLKTNNSVQEKKVKVINNPITGNFRLKDKKDSKHAVKQLITVGSLTKVKGHKRLLKILSKLNFPFHYTIIGNGIEKENLFRMVGELNLTDKITHIPFTDDVSKYLEQSDLFLQGSYVEGFPNALLESCVVGTPVVAFDAPGGTKEIIENEINGYIAGNEKEYLDYVERALNKIRWNPQSIHKSVTDKFSRKNIIGEYESLFLSLVD